MWRCALLVAWTWAAPCPEITPGGSKHSGTKCNLIVENKIPEDLTSHWVEFEGKEREGSLLFADGTETQQSYSGHKFRWRTSTGVLVMEYVIPDCPSGNVRLEILHCDGVPEANPDDSSWYDATMEETYAKLVLPTQCPTSGSTAEWSCVRSLSTADVEARVQGTYGFLPNETKGVRKPYQVIDEGYVEHIPQIPHLTPQGFVIMWQTDVMRQTLGEFWDKYKNTTRVKVHEPIAGMYSNVHAVSMDKLDMDNYPNIRAKVVKEMQKVLEWWTHLRLRHTSTFGIRIYKKDSMLINHVDRHDTHLASAVIQVGQDTDAGWPLELISPSGVPIEVYLQPGQMVLYEGARLFHGRPMRFTGRSFANLFSHFSPVGYAGLGKGQKFDYRYRTGDVKVGWPRQQVQGRGDSSEICEDKPKKDEKAQEIKETKTKETKDAPAPQKAGAWWWPF